MRSLWRSMSIHYIVKANANPIKAHNNQLMDLVSHPTPSQMLVECIRQCGWISLYRSFNYFYQRYGISVSDVHGTVLSVKMLGTGTEVVNSSIPLQQVINGTELQCLKQKSMIVLCLDTLLGEIEGIICES